MMEFPSRYRMWAKAACSAGRLWWAVTNTHLPPLRSRDVEAFRVHGSDLRKFCREHPEGRQRYSGAPGRWSLLTLERCSQTGAIHSFSGNDRKIKINLRYRVRAGKRKRWRHSVTVSAFICTQYLLRGSVCEKPQNEISAQNDEHRGPEIICKSLDMECRARRQTPAG